MLFSYGETMLNLKRVYPHYFGDKQFETEYLLLVKYVDREGRVRIQNFVNTKKNETGKVFQNKTLDEKAIVAVFFKGFFIKSISNAFFIKPF